MDNEEINLKSLSIVFLIGLILLIGLFFIFTDKGTGDNKVSGASIVSNETVIVSTINSPPVYPDIGEVKIIKNCGELNLEDDNILLIDDFEKDDSKKYAIEKHKSELELSLDNKNSVCGNYLKIRYSHKDTSEFHTARINFNRDSLSLPDFKKYDYVNFLARFEKDTYLINFLITDRDKDFWWFKNVKPLTKDTWYLFKVPLDKLYTDKDYPSHGDGKQDFDDGRFTFAFEPGPESNVVYLDTFFVSK